MCGDEEEDENEGDDDDHYYDGVKMCMRKRMKMKMG